jgi:RNA-directed DNA polymerase
MVVRSLKHLYYLLGTNKEELDFIISHLDYYYSPYSKPKRNHDGSIRKNKGVVLLRDICPSISALKKIQENINKKILNSIFLPEHIQGGVKGKDNISNAHLHKGNKYFLTTDLKDFFPSISYKSVYKMFINNGFSADVSSILTKLTTYRHCIPQGIPTSTYIANLVAIKLDEDLLNFCKKNGIKYTRFVDDLTFSSKIGFIDKIETILNIVSQHSYKRSHRKTKCKIGPTEITGIVVKNNSIKPPIRIKDKYEIATKESSKVGLSNYIYRIKLISSKKKKKIN